MQNTNKNLLIVENQTSFSVNALLDEAIIEKRVIERDYKYAFLLIYGDAGKLVAFKRVALVGTNPYRQKFFTAKGGLISKECDFSKAFQEFVNELQEDAFDVVLGGSEKELGQIKTIVKNCSLIDPHLLFDKEVFSN
jgi:hypothetical protein